MLYEFPRPFVTSVGWGESDKLGPCPRDYQLTRAVPSNDCRLGGVPDDAIDLHPFCIRII